MRQVVPVQKGLYRLRTTAHFTVYIYNTDIPVSHPGFWFLGLVMCHGALSTRELEAGTGARNRSPAGCLAYGANQRFLHRKLRKPGQ